MPLLIDSSSFPHGDGAKASRSIHINSVHYAAAVLGIAAHPCWPHSALSASQLTAPTRTTPFSEPATRPQCGARLRQWPHLRQCERRQTIYS